MENSFSRHSWLAASRKPHLISLNRAAFIRKQNPFVCFAVTEFVVHSSPAGCPDASPKECSLWKTPSPDTPGTLSQGNHAFIRKQNFSCFSRLLNSGSSFSRQLHGLFTKGMLLMENSFSRYSWYTASGKPHLTSLNRATFVRKQNPFVFFAAAVVKFVYALSEPYRPKRLSSAIS